jgi:hypothetical protein
MNSRQRVEAALRHEQPDRVPLDLGASPLTGMHVSSVYRLRQALGLDEPGTPVKVVEPYQMLGEIKPDLLDAVGADVVELPGPRDFFGCRLADWKPWTMFDGTPVLVPGGLNTEPSADGNIYVYPQGDRSVPPSGKMPNGGCFFDAIERQQPIDDDNLNVEDNLEEFEPVSDATLEYYATESQRLSQESDRAILASFGGTSFGDISLVPGAFLKHPKGIRGIEEWYVSTVTRFDYVYELFTRQCEIALKNLPKIKDAVGDRVSAVYLCGTDFGTQNGPFIGLPAYRKLYKPFQRRINDWVHENTNWKTFVHSCGSIVSLLPDMIDAGFDILNPVQCSAAGMDPQVLKDRFGDKITFWGGSIDTQKTLPFGTPDDVRREAAERIKIFSPGGGFVFNPVHNVQAKTPVENLMALYASVREHRGKLPNP